MKVTTARFRVFLLVLLIFGLALSGEGRQIAAQDDTQYFSQTGHSISGKFLQYWKTNGGLATYGYPITDAQPEVDPETGHTFLTQWFERNRFELHPEYAGTRYEVLLGLLGKDIKREALGVDSYFRPTDPLQTAGQRFFPETRHNLGLGFRQYWETNGGLERFGYPLSEEHQELDPETGQVFITQWFERARFEYHPENKAPYDVLLGLLGNQLKIDRGRIESVWQIQTGPNSFGGIATDSLFLDNQAESHLYLTDTTHNLIKRYSSGGIYEAVWNSAGGDPTNISLNRIATDKEGNIYVSIYYGPNHNSQRLDKFDKQGKFITTVLDWKSPVAPNGYSILREVNGLQLDEQNNIYELTSGRVIPGSVYPIISSFVSKYDPTGKLLMTIGVDGKGDGQFAFSNPARGLAVDSNGNIYVADTDNYRIEKFGKDGKFLAKWGSQGSGNGQFTSLGALAVDRQNNLYAADSANIQKFDSSGHFLVKWSLQGNGEGQFNGVGDLAVDGQNNVFLLDNYPQQLQKFRQR